MNCKNENKGEDIGSVLQSQTKGTQPKKTYVKPVFQKHETLRVAANATKSNKGVQQNFSNLFN